MKIVVCIKQVPGTSQVEIDPETGVLKRDGAAAKINPYDLYALETAMRLKERCGGTVTAVTMGPPQAEALRSLYDGRGSGVCIYRSYFRRCGCAGNLLYTGSGDYIHL